MIPSLIFGGVMVLCFLAFCYIICSDIDRVFSQDRLLSPQEEELLNSIDNRK